VGGLNTVGEAQICSCSNQAKFSVIVVHRRCHDHNNIARTLLVKRGDRGLPLGIKEARSLKCSLGEGMMGGNPPESEPLFPLSFLWLLQQSTSRRHRRPLLL
jgi:hypothetical protein